MMCKKILSVLLCLCLVLTALMSTALAAEPGQKTVTVANPFGEGEKTIDVDASATVIFLWQSDWDNPSAWQIGASLDDTLVAAWDYHIYGAQDDQVAIILLGNTTLDKTLEIHKDGSGTVYVSSEKGESHTLYRGENCTGDMIQVSQGRTLQMDDVILDGNKGSMQNVVRGGLIAAGSSSSSTARVILNNCILQNNSVTDTSGQGVDPDNPYGTGTLRVAANSNERAEVVMNGSKIINNQTVAGHGTGAYVGANGTLILNGVEISGNHSGLGKRGSGVDVHGVLKVSGSTVIQNNTSETTETKVPFPSDVRLANGCKIEVTGALTGGAASIGIDETLGKDILFAIGSNYTLTADSDRAPTTGDAAAFFCNGSNDYHNHLVDNQVKFCTCVPQPTYSVTYTDGVDGEEIFADQVYSDLKAGDATPAFEGEEPFRAGYFFRGWTPDVEATVSGNAVYTAVWEKDPVLSVEALDYDEDIVLSEIVSNEYYRIRVVTEGYVEKIGLYNEYGLKLIVRDLTCTTNDDGTLTWIGYTTTETVGDARTLYIKPTVDGELKESRGSYTVKILPSTPVVRSAVIEDEVAEVNAPFTMTVVTDKTVSKLHIYNEYGLKLVGQTTYVEQGNDKVWTVTMTAGTAGNERSFKFVGVNNHGVLSPEVATSNTIQIVRVAQ